MKNMFFAALICCAALVLSACGDAADKTADHATGKAQLEQKKKLENKLNSLQKNQQNQLDQALKDK